MTIKNYMPDGMFTGQLPWDWFGVESVDQGGWYWWWNEDEDCAPVPVSVMRSGTDGTFFATAGQLGWTHSQQVLDMGGYWMKIVEPSPPIVQ